ncbi:MAG: hypothetical protein JSW55_02090 [Chloroflexota bacterium]|nr:MAG: hypothetical protein JSW55_02090 [Chloroflexota bacterium]
MSQRKILVFWLPLFASWLLMTMEGPFVSAIINRLPDEVIMLAAMGIVTSLSVTIESPIINLLATSTALTRDRPAYLLLRKFTFHWMIFLTAITVLLAFTPLFDLVIVQLMNVPPEVAAWVRPGLRIMTFWSAAIAWRRFLQGIMIRFNQTRKVAWGTVIRLVASGGTALLLATMTEWAGVIIGASSLMAGVIAEAAYATFAVQPVLDHDLGPSSPLVAEAPLTYKALFWFHLPLATTSLLTLLVQPLVAFSLARSPNPTLSLAAWPVVFQFMLIARAAAFALPEVIIALTEGEPTFRPLRRFSLTLTAASTLFMVVFIVTPLLGLYLFVVQDLTAPVAAMAREGLVIFLALPGLTTLISWIRGLLIDARATGVVNGGMAINLVVTAALLFFGVAQGWPGINSAALALSLAAAAEFLFLWWRVSGVLRFRFSILDLHRSPVAS